MAKFLDAKNRVSMNKTEMSKLKLKWTAPEVIFYDILANRSYFYAKSDVWSFGSLLFLIKLKKKLFRF